MEEKIIVLIDNYDSFVHNLARYIRLAGHDTCIIRNDEKTVEQVLALCPRAIVISPGPSTPENAGISMPLIRAVQGKIPVLGVCLGHQCIGEVLGAKTVRAIEPLHGQSSKIYHQGKGIFKNIPSPFSVGRYHSLIVSELGLPPDLIDARSEIGEVMAISDEDNLLYGVQFHPESIMTEYGNRIIENFFGEII